MLKGSNKMQDKDTEKTLNSYFYPDHGVTISAASQEEADEKLQSIINNK